MSQHSSAKQFVQSLYPSAICKWVKVLPNEFVITVSFAEWNGFESRQYKTVELEWATTAIGAWCAMRELINAKIMEKLNS